MATIIRDVQHKLAKLRLKEHKHTVSAYMTLAPPPATMVQIRPFGLRTVNFKDALVCKIPINKIKLIM